MAIITVTTQLNDKNMRTVNTHNGQKQVVSVPVVKDKDGKWVYASAFINFEVHHGDILTISGRIEQKDDGQYKNNNFVFPTVERLYQPQQQQTSTPDFGRDNDYMQGGTPLNITDDDLPF
jgi:starvation-inducible outer membrane lipoprotein